MERTITLVWDEAADSWRDKYSNQKIAVIPPGMTLVWTDGPSQPSTDHRSIKLALTPDQVRKMVNRAIEDRIVGTNMYFAHRDKLATAGFVREVVDGTNRDVEWLRERIVNLERPWYKRWFSR